MNKEEMLEKLKDYLEMEYRDLVRLGWDRNRGKGNTLQRGLGACMFIQRLDIPFEEIDEIYKTFKTAVEDLWEG